MIIVKRLSPLWLAHMILLLLVLTQHAPAAVTIPVISNSLRCAARAIIAIYLFLHIYNLQRMSSAYSPYNFLQSQTSDITVFSMISKSPSCRFLDASELAIGYPACGSGWPWCPAANVRVTSYGNKRTSLPTPLLPESSNRQEKTRPSYEEP